MKFSSVHSRLSLIFLICALPVLCTAQNRENSSQSVTISVSATVMGGTVEMITIQSMDFENIEREESVIRVDPITSERAGKMIARGDPNANFRIDYIRQRELANLEGEGLLYFNYEVAGSRIDDQETAELFNQDIRDLQFNDEGEFYIWIGGSVDLGEVNPGSYQGEFTIEIEYI